MENKDFRALLRRTLAIPVIALAILAAVLLWETQYLNSSLKWVDHTDQVIGASEQLAKLIVDMESGIRGFFGTGNEDFLLPANKAKPSIDAQFETIKQLISDNPAQEAQLAVLRQRFDEWLRYEQERIELRRATKTRLEASLQGKQFMDSLRAEHDAFIANEAQLRTQRVQTARNASRLVTLTCALLTLTVGLLLAIFTRRRMNLLAANFQKSLDTTEKERDRLSALINSISDEIWFADTEKRFTLANPAALRQFRHHQNANLDVEKFAASLEVYRPDGSLRPVEESPALRALRGEVVTDQEEIIRTPLMGDLRHRQVSSVPVMGPSGNVIGSVSVVRDITERKQAEDALREREALLQTVAESSRIGLVMLSSDRRYLYANSAYAEVLGLSTTEIVGKRVPDVMGHVYDQISPRLDRAFAGERVTYELKVPTQQGMDDAARNRFYAITYEPLPDRGEGSRVIVVVVDITERKQAEAERDRLDRQKKIALDAAQLGWWHYDPVTNISTLDDRYQEIFGVLGHQSPNDEILTRLNSDDLPEVWANVEAALDPVNPKPYSATYRINMPNGSQKWIEAHGLATFEGEGQNRRATSLVGTVQDITARKQSDAALRQSLERLERVLEVQTVGVMFWDLNTGNMVDANDAFLALMGYSRSDVDERRLNWQTLTPPEYFDVSRAEVEKFMATGRVGPYEKEYFRKDGTRKWLLFAGSSLGNNQCVEFCVDISDRKKTEQALRESETEFRALAHNLVSGVALINARGEFVIVNKSFLSIFDLDEHCDILNINSRDWSQWAVFDENLRLLDVDEHPVRQAVLSRTAVKDKLVAVQSPVRAGLKWLLVSAEPILDAQDNLLQVICTYHDITDRKQAEEALRKSEGRWATTLQSIGDAVISTDSTGHIAFMNEVAQRLTGWPLAEAQGRELSVVFNIVQEITRIRPENPVTKVIRSGKVVGLANHTLLIRRDGLEVPIEDSGAPIRNPEGEIEGVVLVFHDVSEQRKVEKALRSSDRLATTGRLAATIAHEIHNPLDAVANLLFLIGDQATAETKEFVTLATQELARVTQMTQQMLSFQREATKPVPVKISDVLTNVVALYDRKIRSSCLQLKQQVEFEGDILALPGELRQVFANLVGNAIEAVGPRRGTITLRAYASHDWRRQQRGLRVVVADDGPGIPAEVRGSIFEPFFTTKGESGTGLGLWITSDILRKYNGTMRLRSRTQSPHTGTCFSVFLPFDDRQNSGS